MENDRTAHWPARILVLVLGCLATISCPTNLELCRAELADWGNTIIRHCHLGFCFLLAIISWTSRDAVNRRFNTMFQTKRKFVFAVVSAGLSCWLTLLVMELGSESLSFPFPAVGRHRNLRWRNSMTIWAGLPCQQEHLPAIRL